MAKFLKVIQKNRNTAVKSVTIIVIVISITNITIIDQDRFHSEIYPGSTVLIALQYAHGTAT